MSDKYGVNYKNREILIGYHWVAHNTNFMRCNDKYYYAMPVYDTLEEAEAELQRFNSCRLENCNK
jgi:hypothetical protein